MIGLQVTFDGKPVDSLLATVSVASELHRNDHIGSLDTMAEEARSSSTTEASTEDEAMGNTSKSAPVSERTLDRELSEAPRTMHAFEMETRPAHTVVKGKNPLARLGDIASHRSRKSFSEALNTGMETWEEKLQVEPVASAVPPATSLPGQRTSSLSAIFGATKSTSSVDPESGETRLDEVTF